LVGAITVSDDGAARFSIESRHSEPVGNLTLPELLSRLLDEVGRSLIFDLDRAVALHGASVLANDNKIVLIAGPTGAGKSTLAAWLAENGMDYLSDEIVLLGDKGRLWPFRRALVVKPGARDIVGSLEWARPFCVASEEGGDLIVAPPPLRRPGSPLSCRLILFPLYEAGSGVAIESLSSAQATVRLMECNLNARNIADHGLQLVRDLALRVPAIRLRYGGLDDLVGILDQLIRLLDPARLGPSELHRILSAFRVSTPQLSATPGNSTQLHPIPLPTPRRNAPAKLTVGMATYDDYDGVYFTIQALRLYHPEILSETEFVVIDNHPTGPCAQALKDLETWIPNYRYVPRNDRLGTAMAKDAVFEEASGEFVLCIDSHVFVVPGGVRRLLNYFDRDPDTKDLLQGPLVYDDLKTLSTHFEPAWRGGMYGTWATHPAGADPEADPFPIPMQGTGLFACRRAVWPGFNPDFRGFGGEEGYIHEKFRQAGGRTLCLPFLRWMHRFGRPLGIPYPNIWEDRIRNYYIGRIELGLQTADIESHFKELLGEALAVRILDEVKQELKIAS
jgi:hypothetical protein